MKFGWKIFFLCMGIYIISLTVTGVVVTENTYNSLLKKEVARAVEEESNLHSTLLLYLRNNQRIVQEKVALRNYSRSIVDTVKNDGNYLEIYDDKLNLLATNAPRTWYYPRQELEVALQGQKNFVLRKDDEGFYLFVSNVLKLEEEKIVLSLIKNITHVENHRREQYLFFLRTGLIGLGFVAVITWLLSTLLLKPLRNLTLAAQKIASGDTTVRTNIKRKDEVGILAAQFDLMADNIEQKITQLEEEGQRQQRFIDNLTHELRTPLTSIIGYADYLQKAAYDPEVLKKGLRYIYEEGKRLLNVSKTLTNMILIREKPLRREKAAVIPLLHEVKKIMHIKAQKNEIVLEVAGQDVTLNLDKELFKVALCNLVDNAINASRKKQKVTLGVEKTADTICVYVADEGKGMDEKEIKNIVEPFYRIDKSRSRKKGGVGLGLAICHQIVTEHGAQLEIESKLGAGSKFKIIFSL